jgi:hypothetical protein
MSATEARAWQPAALPMARCVVPHLCSQIPVVTRAIENSYANRMIGVICPFLPLAFFAKFLPISRMIGRGGHYRPIAARFLGVVSVVGSMMRRGRVNFIGRES